ncbi:hypothetical protein ABID21_002557 [Pseudorhizobium tarimense]|uniref:Uncharacterized protein n=1 Tax=Pseudorhizobium tarimense TaxID=1079109 RepID=A0ABV2H7C5_9HYPH|nr:hypothetical protein [Pseudorhizobium tarimense]MCJ8519716.1 hypothetical protein [Pseudorhizobium tarimense]
MADKNKDEMAQEAVENRDGTAQTGGAKNPAGPHAKDTLVDKQKTPGAGSLPDEKGREADVGPD